MTRPRLLLVLVPLAYLPAAVAPGAPVPEEARRPPEFYPAALGTRWVYAAGRVEVTVEVTEVEEERGVKTVTARRIEDGRPGRVWETVRVSRDGLFVSDDGGIACDPPPCLLRVPSRAGDRWAVDFSFGDRRCTGSRTAGAAEEVEVPAGRFTAVPVSSELRLEGVGGDRTTIWYAPRVGEVKMVAGPGAVRVLKSFTPGR